MMRLLSLSVLIAVACTAPASQPPAPPPKADTCTPAPTPGPVACGAETCSAEQSCVAKADVPGVPACLAIDDCNGVPASGEDLVSKVLGAVGRTRCNATVRSDYLRAPVPQNIVKDPWRLAHFGPIHSQPLSLPGWGDRLVDAFPRPCEATATSRAIVAAAAKLGYTLDTTRPYHPIDEAATPLASAVADLSRRLGGTPDAAAIEADAADVPQVIQLKLAVMVKALETAARARKEAFATAGDLATLYAAAPSLLLATRGQLDPGNDGMRKVLLEKIDFAKLYQASHDLAAAVEDLELASHAGATGFAFDQATPLGRIVIGDGTAQTYEDKAGPVAMIVDFGGDDTYRVPAGATDGPQMAAALLVDVAGNDHYGYVEARIAADEKRLVSDDGGRATNGKPVSLSEHPRQGAGRCGIGLAFDLAGNDDYRSLRMSQGFGALGVGVLYDRDGNDAYELEIGGQGSATFGIGLHLDVAGDDVRKIYAFGQGFGHVASVGALIDGAGADQYLANVGNKGGGDTLYESAQIGDSGNSSFVQGAAFGRRPPGTGDTAEKLALYSMSGGVGLLADFGAGDDHYVASVFAQATGYWFGTGVLYDEAGNDKYDGKYYVQGATAHFALSYFHDGAGDDLYNQGDVEIVGTSVGIGHDWSVSYLVDDSGNDKYIAPGLGMGSGNACGWGVFVDRAGDDTYAADGAAFGSYGYGDAEKCSYFQGSTIGLFLDGAGTDTYLERSGKVREGRNDAVIQERPYERPVIDAKGAFVDGTGSILFLP